MTTYTKEHIRFILENWQKNENLCITKTKHSKASIKLMFNNIAASYGFLNFSKGNPMYSLVADEYRNKNLIFNKPMSKESFCKRFDILKCK